VEGAQVLKRESEAQTFEKRRIRMADGREMVFYTFPPSPPKEGAPPKPSAAKPRAEER
jgi:hypothetical protein